MTTKQKIAHISVTGLHEAYDYEFEIPETEETVIIIAPNGFGKTALLSLINDCLSLNLLRAANRVFRTLTITFRDQTQWRFTRKVEEMPTPASREDYDLFRRRRRARPYSRGLKSPYWVDLVRLDAEGIEVEETLPDLSSVDRRAILRTIERNEPWLLHISEPDLFQSASGTLIQKSEAFERYFELVSSDESVRRIVSVSNPSFVWPSIEKWQTLFIETQRLLYQEHREDSESPSHREEILRQAHRLSGLLQENYSEYASTSQSLDRTFPNRLIERAQSGQAIDPKKLKQDLRAVEQKRKELTDVGILVEQAGPLASTDDDLLPQVLYALQIYVEDSQRKLATYDAIFPKLEVFTELIEKKLSPKKLSISREDGAQLKRGEDKLALTSLSSGEKHEFIMLFKLAFETNPNSLVLIDEPEISLHVVWQLEFMKDLSQMQRANPFQCIIATHSPQIFQAHKHLVIDLADQA